MDASLPRLLVAGGGSMGQNHVRLLAHSRICRLAGVADANPATAAALSRAYGVPAFASVREAMDTRAGGIEFDAAVVATPTETHREVTGLLLEAGKHVLVEKPVAATHREALELAGLARAKKLVLMGGHVERYNPAVVLLREKIGDLGPVYHLESERTGPFPERVFALGVAVDLLPHDLDLMLALTPLRPEWVFAHQERRLHPVCEDGIAAMLGFPGGVLGIAKANWLSPVKTRRFRVYGQRGMFEVDFLGRNLTFHENRHTRPVEDSFGLVGMEEGDQVRFKITPSEPLASELEHFIGLVRVGRAEEDILGDNIETIRLVELIRRSAERSEKVSCRP